MASKPRAVVKGESEDQSLEGSQQVNGGLADLRFGLSCNRLHNQVLGRSVEWLDGGFGVALADEGVAFLGSAALRAHGNPLETPLQQQGALDALGHGRELARPGRARATPLGLLMEVARGTAIAAQLTADGRLVSSQLTRYHADGIPLHLRCADLGAFLVLQMAVALGRIAPPHLIRAGPSQLLHVRSSHRYTSISCVALPCFTRVDSH